MRVPSGDQDGAFAPSLRNARGVPPVMGMSITPVCRRCPRSPRRRPKSPISATTAPGGSSGGISAVRLTKRPGADLAHPEVELSGAVGQERDEPPIGRNLGAAFRPLPIREAREPCVGQRGIDRYCAPGQPTRNGRQQAQQDDRDAQRATPAPRRRSADGRRCASRSFPTETPGRTPGRVPTESAPRAPSPESA